MPNFKTHQYFNYAILLLSVIAYFYYTTNGNINELSHELSNLKQHTRLIVITLFAYVLGTELLTPDLDTNSTPYKRLWFIYSPLKYYLAPHRSKSHIFWFGPVVQLIYLAIVVTTIIYIIVRIGIELNYPTDKISIYNINTYDIIGLSIGIILSNWAHIITDDIYSIFGWRCS